MLVCHSSSWLVKQLPWWSSAVSQISTLIAMWDGHGSCSSYSSHDPVLWTFHPFQAHQQHCTQILLLFFNYLRLSPYPSWSSGHVVLQHPSSNFKGSESTGDHVPSWQSEELPRPTMILPSLREWIQGAAITPQTIFPLLLFQSVLS